MSKPREVKRECPSCHRTVDASASRCTFCGADFSKEPEGPVEGEWSPKEFLDKMADREREEKGIGWSLVVKILLGAGALIILIGPFLAFGKAFLPLLVFDILLIGVFLFLFLLFRQ